MIKLIYIAIALAAASAASASAANPTAIFDPMLRTLTVTKNGNLMEDAVVSIDGSDRLVFSFDEIADDRRYLRCRLLHCNADWEPSRLVESEYVDGFNQDEIDDFGFSQNTYIHYLNYRYEMGQGEGLQPLVSGNYLWQVYDEQDPDAVLLQTRFRVSDDLYRIGGVAHGRTDKGFNDQWQQLELAMTPLADLNCSPYTDLIVEVTQNGRPDTSRLIMHPQRVEGERVIYEHLPQLIFPAGNEYRRFETVRTNYPGMGVEHTEYQDPMYHAYLATAESRAGRSYIYDSTQRGRYKVDEYNATDPDLGADYVMTHFSLDFPEVMDGDVYVEGDLFLRGYTDVNRMTYDRSEGLYTLAVPLKQGSYNYQYVLRKRSANADAANIGGGYDGSAPADASVVEGNHHETVNEYNVYVYLRQPGSRADRLLGSATIVAR